MRYELTVNPGFAFGSSDLGPLSMAPATEPLAIRSAGRVFVWHPSRPAPDGSGMCCPAVSLIVEGSDSEAFRMAGIAVNRFVAALSYALDAAVVIGWTSATGYKGEFDPPVACGDERRSGLIVGPVTDVYVDQDDRLYEVLGLYRDAIAADNPFHSFLSLHNALVAVFEGRDKDADDFVNSRAGFVTIELPLEGQALAEYFRETLRNAMAHLVRFDGRPTLDPNDPTDRNAAAMASSALREIVRRAVDERWPAGVRAS